MKRSSLLTIVIAFFAVTLMMGCASCPKCKKGGGASAKKGPGKNNNNNNNDDDDEDDDLRKAQDDRDALQRALDDALAQQNQGINNNGNNNPLAVNPGDVAPVIPPGTPTVVPDGKAPGDPSAPGQRGPDASAAPQLKLLLKSSLEASSHNGQTTPSGARRTAE